MAVGLTQPAPSVPADVDGRDRTVVEWMELDDEDEKTAVVIDITGRIELGVQAPNTFLLFLQEIAPYIGPDVSLIDSATGIELLFRVLNELLPEILNRNDISTVVQLLCARIEAVEDGNNYKANIKGVAGSLIAVTRMRNFLKPHVVTILDSFFKLSPELLKQQTVDTRVAVYTLIQGLLDDFQPYLVKIENIGEKLVDGLTRLAQLERNPLPLKIVFSMWAKLSREQEQWRLSETDLEKMWESFMRYYPITISGFNAQSTDSTLPDSVVLNSMLLKCIISSPTYSQWAFPRLLEQTDVSANVKKDVFKTLEACIEVSAHNTLQQWSTRIYDSLKFEILNGEEEFIQCASKVLQRLTYGLTKPALVHVSFDSSPPISAFVVNVVADLGDRLREPSQSYTVQCGRVLNAIASSNAYAFYSVTQLATGMLLQIYKTLDTPETKCRMMSLLNSLLDAGVAVVGVERQPLQARLDHHAMNTLLHFRSSLTDIYFEAMVQSKEDPASVEWRISTIKGFALLFQIPNSIQKRPGTDPDKTILKEVPFLSEYEKGTIVQSLCEVVLSRGPINPMVKEAATKALQQISVRDTKSFASSTLKYFLDELPKSVSSSNEVDVVLPILDVFARITCSEAALVVFSNVYPEPENAMKKCKLFFTFCDSLMSKLVEIIEHKGQLQYANAIVATLYRGMLLFDTALDNEYPDDGQSRYDGKDAICSAGPYGDTIMRLYRLCAARKTDEHNITYMGLRELPCGEVFDDNLLFQVARCAALALRSKHTPDTAGPLDWRAGQRGEDRDRYPHEAWILFDLDFPRDEQSFQQSKCLTGPAEKCSATILSLGIFKGMRVEVRQEPVDFAKKAISTDKAQEKSKLPVADIAADMIYNSTSITSQASYDAHMSFVYILQLLVNKFGAMRLKLQDGMRLAEVMQHEFDQASMQTEAKALKVYQILAYMTQAALLAFDPAVNTLIEMMIDGLLHPSHSKKVAQSFRILLSPSEIIDEKNHCVIRPMAKAKLYHLGAKVLLQKYSLVSQAFQKQNILIALAAVLAHLPLSLYQTDAEAILPLMIAGTAVENAGDGDRTKIDCIEVINTLIPAAPIIIEQHIDSIINRMTDRTHNTMADPSDASINCRVKALQCLATLALSMDPPLILRRRRRVVRELDVAIADISRVVRNAAERTKMVWFNVKDDA